MRSAVVANGIPLPSTQPDPIVPWWSFTKTVLAAAALSLVRDRLLALDDELPEGPFTLRHLLRHQAGLADYGELADYHAAVARGDSPWPVTEMLQRLDVSRLRYAPGTQWRYSNVGYVIVVQVIERVTGLSLAQALDERVVLPLGLSQVRLAKTRDDVATWSPGYDPGWVYHGLLLGPLAQAALLLDRLFSGDLLPCALLQAMQDTLVLGGSIPGRPWTVPGYAMGLMVGDADGGLTLSGHTGSGPGSTFAVYRSAVNDRTATCAAFVEGDDQGGVETEVLRQLMVLLGAG